jgi:hypothetical protein
MIHYKKQPLDSIDEVYGMFNSKEFKSPFRSTIPLLVLFKDNQMSDLEPVQSNNGEPAKYIFEHETPVVGGKPSCTDLMVEYPDSCIAIESKRTEPVYQTVRKWLEKNSNREFVLKNWLDKINSHLRLGIGIGGIMDLPYQLIHRVASACSLGRKQTNVVYLGFDLDKKKTTYYLECLTQFSNIMDNKVHLYLYCYAIGKLEKQKELEASWHSKNRDLSAGLIKGLIDNHLMRLTLSAKYEINAAPNLR